MELLARLLGGTERVKIMRFFLHHEEDAYSLSDIGDKTKSKAVATRKEVNALLAIGFLEKKKTKTVIASSGKKGNARVKEVVGYRLNALFPHNEALKELLFDFQLLDKKELASRFKAVGRIKMFLVSGVFLGLEKSRLDILIVGEAIKKPKVEKIFESLSAEIGRDVSYSVMDVDEYNYRIKMYDKFILDVLEESHEKVIDKINVIQK